MPSSHSSTTLVVAFDDDHAVANAGLLLPATLTERLGIEAVIDALVDLGDRPGAHRPGRKVLTLMHALVAGGDCIDDAGVLRTGSTAAVLSHRVMAPSTLGTFLRSFTFGHIGQLDRVAETLLASAWAAGAGPGDQPMTIDLDSTICEVHGHHKGGAAYGYTRVLGYHPLLAPGPIPARCCTPASVPGGLPPAVARSGSSRARGSGGPRWRHRPADLAGRLGLVVSQGAGCVPPPRHPLRNHRAPDQHRHRRHRRDQRPCLGRHRLPRRRRGAGRRDHPGRRPADRAPHPPARRPGHPVAGLALPRLVTDRQGSSVTLDVDHRRHAVCELAIRDLKDGAGVRHCPSGRFLANAAWLVIATLAHNLLRWVATIGLASTDLLVAKTIRRRLLTLPGRLTRSAGRRLLHLPRDWPWARQFLCALARLQAIPLHA